MIIKNNTKPRGSGAACCSFCHKGLAYSLTVSHEFGLQLDAGGRLVSNMESRNSVWPGLRNPEAVQKGSAGMNQTDEEEQEYDDGIMVIEWRLSENSLPGLLHRRVRVNL